MAQNILKTLYENEDTMDIRLKVEGDEREIKAHRIILMATSKYFQKMFSSNFQEKEAKVVTLKGVDFDYETLQMIVEFLYTGSFFTKKRKTLNNNREVIQAGDYLLMDSVIDEMSDILLASNNLKCCPSLFNVLDKLSGDTKATIEKKILSNMETLRPQIMEMESEDFLELLRSPHAVSLDAKKTLIIIKQWVLDEPDFRKKFSFQLLSAVVFKKSDNLNAAFLMENVQPICECPQSKDFILALLVRFNGYQNAFTDRYLDDSKFITS